MSERLVFGYGASGSGDAPTWRGPEGPSKATPPPERIDAPAERRDWAYLGLLAFTALLYLRPQDSIRPLGMLHLPELAAIFALGSLFFGRLQRGQSITRFTPELGGVLALGGVILATAPFSVWMGGAVATFTDMYAKVVLIFILMVNTLTSPKRIERLTWLLVIASGYIAIGTVIDYARGVNMINHERALGSVGGMFKNPNDLALNMVVALPLALAFLLRRLSTTRKLLALGCAGAMLGAIVASGSRSGTLGLVAMVAVFAIQLMRRRPGLVAGGAVAALLALPLLPASYWTRVASITDESVDDSGSREARTTLAVEAWHAFLDNPLTGVGAGQFVNYNPEGRIQAWKETHNVVLQIAAELGIFGLIAFGYLLVRGFKAPGQIRRLLRQARARGAIAGEDERARLEILSIAMLASLAGWFVCAIFASVAYHWTLYYVLGLAVTPREILTDRLTGDARSRLHATAAIPVGARA
jgi:putative inorganic carbon (HCO3(-)) transporter